MSEAIFDVDGQFLHHCNTTYYIDRTGTVKLRYAKANLWGDERKCFTKGSTHEVFDTQEFGKIGLLICWDLAFPEAFRALIKQDARIIFIPTLWKLPDCGEKGLRYNKRSEDMFINSTITTRAFEQNVCVVFCNTGGPLDEGHFGCSQICMPFLGPIVKLGPEEQVVVKEVQFKSILEDAEDVWNIRADIMSPDWYQNR
jgi:predicted amidohydrolase